MENSYYVYCFLNPLKQGNFNYSGSLFNYEPFYVGKGKGKRLYNSFRKRIEHELIKQILLMINSHKFKENFIIKLNNNLSEEEAIQKEIEYIKKIGKQINNTGPLINISDGGGAIGVEPWNKNKKCPQIGRKGKIPWNKDKTYLEILGEEKTKEISKKMSIARKGKPNPNKGKKCPKISERMTIKVSKENEDKICNLYTKGYGVPEIIKLTNISRGVVERVLTCNNIKKRTTGETKLLKHHLNH